MKWLDEVLPDSEQWGKFSKGLMAMGSQVKDSIQLDPRLKELTDQRMAAWRNWFDSRLDNAIKAAESSENPELDSMCLRFFLSFHQFAHFVALRFASVISGPKSWLCCAGGDKMPAPRQE